MIFKLFKYLFGYVVFSAKGGFAERFINLCAVKRINLWDVSLNGNIIKARINIRDFKRLRSVARKTGVTVSILQKRGLPFYLRAHRDRIGLLVGVCIFIFFMTVMNTFVWCIQTQSSEKLSRHQVLEVAENAGLHYGIRVKKFDEEKAAREIYKAFDGELSWVKVNIKGSLAMIDFRDKVKKLETEEKGGPSNIVADFDGVILSDETYQGSKNKSRGDAVSKGEVLISGVVDGIDMKPLYYQAKGKFTALHQRSIEYSLNDTKEFLNYEVCDQQIILCIFGLKIPVGFLAYPAESNSIYSYERYLEFDGYRLPFGIKKTVVVNHNICNLSESQREQLAVLGFCNEEYRVLSNTRILERNLKMLKENDSLNILAEYKCIDYIGESKAINIENSEIYQENS